jgi:hypothetical protein
MREPIDYGMTWANDYGSVLDVLMRYSEKLEGSGFCDSDQCVWCTVTFWLGWILIERSHLLGYCDFLVLAKYLMNIVVRRSRNAHDNP